jgi:NADH-quinone oxidoreductase subunit K
MAVDESALLNGYLLVGAILFGLGLVGFLSRRNMILMFLAAEMMLQGVSLSLAAWSRFHNNFGGQILVLLIITVAACEAAVALAMILMLFQRRGSLDIALWEELREANLPPYIDRKMPDEPPEEPPEWPRLPVAGIAPTISREQTDYRPHV